MKKIMTIVGIVMIAVATVSLIGFMIHDFVGGDVDISETTEVPVEEVVFSDEYYEFEQQAEEFMEMIITAENEMKEAGMTQEEIDNYFDALVIEVLTSK